MGLSAGRLRHRIDLMRGTLSADGAGYLTTWSAVAVAIPAEVLSLNGRESVIDKVLQGIQIFKITIRWRCDVLDSDQIRYGALDLNIKSAVDPDGRREQLVIVADTEAAFATS